jgi:amidohydrolase
MDHQWPQQLDETIETHAEEMAALRRRLHANPEPSGQEFETSLHIYQLLSDRQFSVQMGPEGRGVIADLSVSDSTPRVAFRADIDALNIQDRKNVPYRSRRPGVMHACGHDAHTAIVYTALIAIEELAAAEKLPWPVPLRGIFEPSEETATGAREMIAAGALEQIEAIFAAHVDPHRVAGRIGLKPGILTANCDAMRMIVNGRGGHAARPHESKDPIAAAAQLISTLYLFVPRATDSREAVVVTIGQIKGGENPNVIPDRVELSGTLRTLDQTVRKRTMEHIRQLARGIEQMSDTTIAVSFEVSVHSVSNDPVLTELVAAAAGEVVGKDQVDQIARPSMGSEDFADFLKQVPGVMFRLGSAPLSGPTCQLHTPDFDIDQRALAIGARILARAAILYCRPGGG